MSKADDALVREAVAFFEEREGAESENRTAFIEDLKFAYEPGAQWEADAKTRRGGRPSYSFNRVAGAINQLIGDQRLLQPSCTARPTNRKASAKTAEMLGGLIRDIEAQSGARMIYSEAFKYEIAGSWGAWRICPEYEDDETFDQVLRVKRIPNPLTVYFDEQADPFGRGAMRCIVAERISRQKYKDLYGEKAHSSLPALRDNKGWQSQDEVRVAEYYVRRAEASTLALLSDGRIMRYSRTLDEELARMREERGEAPTILRKRRALKWYVEYTKIDGTNVLEGPTRYDYKHIPVVRAPGRFVNIEGKAFYQSLHRHAKDPQRVYNYDRSTMVETTALTPRAPWIGSTTHFEGLEDEWSRANSSNQPFLRFNIDDRFPEGRPQRNSGPEVPAAYMAMAQHDADDIRQTTGYFNPALDQQTAAGDAESGRALRTRLMTADSGSYEFLDNFAYAIQYTWEIMIDMIPVHYDTVRTVRLLGLDDRAEFVDLDPDALKGARHDVTATLGPAYATARMEALETLLGAADRMPIIGEVAPDIIVSNLDVQGAAEIERRIRMRLIAQGVVAPNEEDKQALAELPPPPPDPVQEGLARKLAAEAARNEASAQKTAVEASNAAASAQVASRRELLELRALYEEVRNLQAETALALKELRTPIATPERG